MAVKCVTVKDGQGGSGRGVGNDRRDGKVKGAGKECGGKEEGRR